MTILIHLYEWKAQEGELLTWEISYEDDLRLIVQAALDLLELAPPR